MKRKFCRWLFRSIFEAQDSQTAFLQVFIREELKRQAQIIFAAQGAIQKDIDKKLKPHEENQWIPETVTFR